MLLKDLTIKQIKKGLVICGLTPPRLSKMKRRQVESWMRRHLDTHDQERMLTTAQTVKR